MPIKVYHVDAFTDRMFAGNPAAVCLLSGPAKPAWMQAVGAEMNLSETAFLHRDGDGYRLRWFTPKVEVGLCGHATLASAHVMFEEGLVPSSRTIAFHTKSGTLLASRRGDFIELDFPARPLTVTKPVKALEEAIGVIPKFTGRSEDDYLLEIDGEDELRGLKPDFTSLAKLKARGVIVTSPSRSRKYDFISRFFAPAVGIDEDPVTGSAHCSLGPFWGKKLGKKEMVGYQASIRGGAVRVGLLGDRVTLGGKAVTVTAGSLR